MDSPARLFLLHCLKRFCPIITGHHVFHCLSTLMKRMVNPVAGQINFRSLYESKFVTRNTAYCRTLAADPRSLSCPH
ncbi:hypothetical protein DLQ85_10935 [Salmonella enterica subsp. enterica serovar Virchow]|nr:hypothetical protein [Salmonella enterica subsp. enterica serovar Virchow]